MEDIAPNVIFPIKYKDALALKVNESIQKRSPDNKRNTLV